MSVIHDIWSDFLSRLQVIPTIPREKNRWLLHHCTPPSAIFLLTITDDTHGSHQRLTNVAIFWNVINLCVGVTVPGSISATDRSDVLLYLPKFPNPLPLQSANDRIQHNFILFLAPRCLLVSVMQSYTSSSIQTPGNPALFHN